MADLIDRQDAIKAIEENFWEPYFVRDAVEVIRELPSARPEITLESAIDYLHSIGWMQEHDRIMVEFAQKGGPHHDETH